MAESSTYADLLALGIKANRAVTGVVTDVASSAFGGLLRAANLPTRETWCDSPGSSPSWRARSGPSRPPSTPDIIWQSGKVLVRRYRRDPASVARENWKLRRPTSDVVNYANLLEHLWDDEYVEGCQAIGRFLDQHIPLPGGVAEQMVQMWLRDNAFVNDRLRFNGKPVRPADIRIPVLGVVATADDIAPLPSARALADVLPNADVELLEIEAGHVNLFAGRKSVKVVMPKIFEWIAAHSEEAVCVPSPRTYAS